MRSYSGRILLRMPDRIHKELAREAFDSGRSINQLCLEALMARRALKQYDPWKSIDKSWTTRPKTAPASLESDIRKAVTDVRRGRRHH